MWHCGDSSFLAFPKQFRNDISKVESWAETSRQSSNLSVNKNGNVFRRIVVDSILSGWILSLLVEEDGSSRSKPSVGPRRGDLLAPSLERIDIFAQTG